MDNQTAHIIALMNVQSRYHTVFVFRKDENTTSYMNANYVNI